MRSNFATSVLLVVAMCGVAASASSANAQLMLDDWSVVQGPLFQPSSHGVSSSVTGSMFTGQRELRGGNGDSKSGGGYTVEVSGGKLRGTLEANRYAVIAAAWNASSDVHHDLTQGGTLTGFRFDSISTPQLTLGAYNAEQGYQLSYLGGAFSGSNVEIAFDSFSFYNPYTMEFRAATSADFQAVKYLTLQVMAQSGQFSTAQSFEIGAIATIPAPSAGAVMGLAMIGASRRRR